MRIGAYEIEGELGRGGTGVVYRARALDGRAVALKLLSRAASAAARERFERERRLLASFGEADGFVPLLDAGEERGQPYLVMPLLEGGTLRARLAKGVLPVHETIALAEALALAVSKAHERSVVHRDLKPENVLYDRAGRPFIADLGLAKHFDSDSPGASRSVVISKTGQLLGTIGYMAPEQARDAKQTGPAADIFSVGAILYECLAGWPAFEGRTLLEVVAKVDGESPNPIANVRPETPPWLAAVVERALERDPLARYSDGGALLAALRAQQSGPALGRTSRLSDRARKRALLVAPAAIATLALSVAFAATLRGTGAPARREAAGSGSTAGSPPGAGIEGSLAAARARLEGAAPVTSEDAPVSLLASSSPAASRLRELAARRAILYSLTDATRLRDAFPEESEGKALWAMAALGGEADLRARAETALEVAHEVELARPIANLARLSDRVAGSLPTTGPAEGRYTGPALAEYLRPLAAAPRETVDAAVLPLTRVLVARAIGFGAGSGITLKLVHEVGGDDPVAQRSLFPPRLLRACRAASVGRGSRDASDAKDRLRALEAIALESDDATTRAAALGRAILVATMYWRSGSAIDEGSLERDGLELEAVRSRLEVAGVGSASLPPLLICAQRDLCWIHVVLGRGEREDELARGARLADEATHIEGHDTAAWRELARFLLERGSGDATTLDQLLTMPGNEANTGSALVLGLEWRRRHEGAHAVLERFPPPAPSEAEELYLHAVRALALADLGELDDARKELALVPEARSVPPPLTSLSREAVARYLPGREKR